MVEPTTQPLPVALQAAGWQLEEPPAPRMDYIMEACKPPEEPACSMKCVNYAKGGKRPRNRLGLQPLNRSEACKLCECQLCAICSKPVNLYTSPSGQVIETVTTRTEPRFIFAYNPYDDDMRRMRKNLILEPMLTHAWYEATARCCNQTGGDVIDVGGNFGWYTLYSLALGCSVTVFEPVPAYREVMQLGIALNPGFADRVTMYGNVVYDQPGNYTLRVPVASPRGRMKKLGMTGMSGSVGILKADWRAPSYDHSAAAVRIDDVVRAPRGICMVKADVEGYEPQVLQTARRTLTSRRVPALQLELTRTPRSKNQTCAAIKMLTHLAAIGFKFKQVNNRIVDKEAPKLGSWAASSGPWNLLPNFPTEDTVRLYSGKRSNMPSRGRISRLKNLATTVNTMEGAYLKDFRSFSTNLIAMREDSWRCGGIMGGIFNPCPPWPSLSC